MLTELRESEDLRFSAVQLDDVRSDLILIATGDPQTEFRGSLQKENNDVSKRKRNVDLEAD